MRLEPRELAVDAPLTEFGLDSLMAVEIKNRLHHDAGINLPLVQLLEGPSILDLATRCLRRSRSPGWRAGRRRQARPSRKLKSDRCGARYIASALRRTLSPK